MGKFKQLIFEQSRRTDPYSPVFDMVKHMEPEEIDYLENHDSNPSKTNLESPPAQLEWQWEDPDQDFVYNIHLLKQVYNNSRRPVDPSDTDTAKRYVLLGFAYNKNNNMIGEVPDYTFVSDEFMSPADTDVLKEFLSDKQFLYDNDTDERKVYSFTRASDFDV